ncbi:MAG: D-TA family PLP-dependent enzyme, partial [Gemmatimonadetes bacterium]|nr:D-TA family PLP-dependent enzyme [Gemmatimonadota bacterium]
QVVLDAGVKAIGREPMRGADAPGYACVVGRPDLVVTRLSEEHGVVALEGTDWSPRVGDQVRLVPNHACVAVHNFDAMHVIDPDGRVEVLPVAARGR